MKTSVFGFGTSGMNWTQAIDYVAALGAAGIEPYPMAELQTPSLPAARRIGDYAREKGLELPCFSTAAQLTGEKAPAEIERLCRYADVCAEMGISYLHHTLIPALEPAGVPRDMDAAIDEAAGNARAVFDYAQSVNVQCIYEDQGYCVNGVRRFEHFLRALDRPAGVVADLGNILFAGERAQDFAGRFAPLVRHVHVKDYLFKDGRADSPGDGWYKTLGGDYLRGTVIGHGVIPFRRVMAQLLDAGYDGWYSMEYDGLEDMKTAHALGLRNMRRYYEQARLEGGCECPHMAVE